MNGINWIWSDSLTPRIKVSWSGWSSCRNFLFNGLNWFLLLSWLLLSSWNERWLNWLLLSWLLPLLLSRNERLLNGLILSRNDGFLPSSLFWNSQSNRLSFWPDDFLRSKPDWSCCCSSCCGSCSSSCGSGRSRSFLSWSPPFNFFDLASGQIKRRLKS